MSFVLPSFSLFFLENFKLLLLIKALPIKRRVNLNIERSILLANKTARFFLELYLQNNIIQNNSRPKPDYKIIYCFSKHMLLRGIRPRGNTKYQKFDNIIEDR